MARQIGRAEITDTMRLKRNSHLFLEWSADGLALISPVDARTMVRAGQGIVRLLSTLDDWTLRSDVSAFLFDQGIIPERAEELLHILIRNQVLVQEGHEGTRIEAPWDAWGSISMLYHQHSRNARYVIDAEAKDELVMEVTAAPAPDIVKSYSDLKRIYLPRHHRRIDAYYYDVLLNRRSYRSFTAQPLELQDFACLLHIVFGPQRFVDAGSFGTLQLKTTPNAGARHEIECYVIAFNVLGIPPGLYHYDSLAQALEALPVNICREQISDIMYDQPMAETAPMICLTTAVTERSAYKYQHGRAYRLLFYNVGHLGQTFALTATALGMGTFQTAAFRDSVADDLLGIDGSSEFVTYVLGCGKVGEASSTLPLADFIT